MTDVPHTDAWRPPADGWDYATAYREMRTRVTGLVRAHSDAELDERAPATPEWRVRDVVAHLAGVTDDVANGRLEGVGTNAWTEKQVETRREWPLEDVLSRWQEHSSALEPTFASFPEVAVGQLIMDTFTHEQDIRGALKSPGGRDSTALAIAFDWTTERLGERMTAGGEGTLVIETEAGSKTIGTGEPVSTLRADRLEIVRAMVGRRSADQLERLDRDGPFDPRALLLSTAIFSPAAHDLVE